MRIKIRSSEIPQRVADRQRFRNHNGRLCGSNSAVAKGCYAVTHSGTIIYLYSCGLWFRNTGKVRFDVAVRSRYMALACPPGEVVEVSHDMMTRIHARGYAAAMMDRLGAT